MSEENKFETEEQMSRKNISKTLHDSADQIEFGGVTLVGDLHEQSVTVTGHPRFRIELKQLTGSEHSDQRYNLVYEIQWTK